MVRNCLAETEPETAVRADAGRLAKPVPRLTEAEMARVWRKVHKTATCWLWVGAISSTGYGSVRVRKVGYSAHRLMYEQLRGAVPRDLKLDHLCRVRACVNPDHLEPVTHRENVHRGDGMRQPVPTHCPAGHPYTTDNTAWIRPPAERNARNYQRCKTCRRERRRRAAQLRGGRQI